MERVVRYGDTTFSNKGKVKLIIDGYIFVNNKTLNDVSYWKCDLRRSNDCGATAITTLIGSRYRIDKSTSHNHSADVSRITSTDVSHRTKLRARETRERPCQVVQNVLRSVPSVVIPDLANKSLYLNR
jgi:hypothetical protein